MSNKAEKSPLRQKDIRTGAQQERERIIAMLESLRERYNLESMNLNEIRVAKYEALSSAVALIKGENE